MDLTQNLHISLGVGFTCNLISIALQILCLWPSSYLHMKRMNAHCLVDIFVLLSGIVSSIARGMSKLRRSTDGKGLNSVNMSNSSGYPGELSLTSNNSLDTGQIGDPGMDASQPHQPPLINTPHIRKRRLSGDAVPFSASKKLEQLHCHNVLLRCAAIKDEGFCAFVGRGWGKSCRMTLLVEYVFSTSRYLYMYRNIDGISL